MCLYSRWRGVGIFTFGAYWSSTEATSSRAWNQNCSGGGQTNSVKTSALSTRPIRMF